MRMGRWLAIGLAVLLAGGAAAQTYPDKPIKVVNGFAPGGGTDLLLRTLLPKLGEMLGQQLIIDYRPGAGANLAMDLVAKAAPDGYTLLMGSPGLAINPSLYKDLPFDPLKDFAPISLIGTVPNVLVVNPALPVHSVAELVALARKEPGKLNFASPGAGSSLHLSAELFKALEKIDIVHVPYKGGAQAMTDVLAGKPEMMFQVLGVALPYIESGKLRALAVTSAERAAVLPNVPTMMEAGVKNYAAVTWNGLLAPAGTPQPIIDKLHAAVVKALQDPSIQEGYRKIGQVPAFDTPAEFQALIRDEASKWSRVIKDANIQAQ
ncbi:tripartite tricarboxylate transporter substrate binding protein [Reyranella sp.]|uniref:tripartite tricarboxylate transporter substrate binding protein n=1 Tax=Reyranella sp. TaxID=1929291 RepID=UPI00378529EA